MQDAVTVSMTAPADRIWGVVSDVTAIGRYSPETFEARWLDGATGPAVGNRFAGHVKRNGRGPVYWSPCRITACEPGREFGFVVEYKGRPIIHWHYRLVPDGEGTAVTESFRLEDNLLTRAYWALFGWARLPFNQRNMRTTLERIKADVEAG